MGTFRVLVVACAAAITATALVLACGSFDETTAPAADDAGGTPDAPVAPGRDVVTPADAGPTRWCDGPEAVDAAFCADFDGVDFAEAFDGGAQVNSGFVFGDTDASYSAPRSLRSVALASSVGATAAPLGEVFRFAPKVMRLRFRLFIPSDHPPTFGSLVNVRFYGDADDGGPGFQGQAVEIVARGADFTVEELLVKAATRSSHPIPGGIPTGRWVHVDWTLHFGSRPASPGSGSVALALDGVVVMNTSLTVAMEAPTKLLVLHFGLFADMAPKDWAANYDDLRVDFE